MEPAQVVHGLLATHGVAQVGFVVPDVAAAVDQHGSASPFSVMDIGPDSKPVFRYRGDPGRYSVRIAINGSSPQLEYIQPLEGPSHYHDHVQTVGYGFHHLAIRVPSVADVTATLRGIGVAVLAEGSGYGEGGSGAYAHFDTGLLIGCVLEAFQATPE